jgi:long-subunit acyl-CoA synthetase (AMP-forming)
VPGYGLTEVSCVASITLKTYDKRKEGSVGLVVPKAEFKVVNTDGQALPLGEKGELLFRGPNVMRGYWNNPEATSETLTEDGWMRTGDVAYIDQDGYVFLVDRLKELIKVKGYQVF